MFFIIFIINVLYCIVFVCFDTRLNDFDPEEDKFMAISLNYRGDVKSKEANATVQWLKNNKKCATLDFPPRVHISRVSVYFL